MSIPSSVDAIAIAKTGGVEVIEKRRLPFVTDPGHIIVKVQIPTIGEFILNAAKHSCDPTYRQGIFPLKGFPAVLGKEAGGTIIRLPTDEQVLNSPEYRERGYLVGNTVAVDVLPAGAFATYISVPWKTVYPLPLSVSPFTAAATLVQGITAVTFFEEAYRVKRGDIILIHTVAGGLGLLFTQLAKSRGAIVIGTTSTSEKANLARSYGADHVLLYPVDDVVKKVLEITNGDGVHAIFDGVGKDTFENNFKMVKRKGTIVVVGNASGTVPPFPILKLVEKNVTILRPTMNNYLVTPSEILHYGNMLFSLVAEGALKVNVTKEYPFTAEGVQQAQQDLTGGKTVGKLIIKVD